MAKKPDLFGLACRQIRAARGLTLADQAKALGYSPSFISQIETRQRPAPDGYVASLAESLGLSNALRDELENLAGAARSVVRIHPSDDHRAIVAAQFGRVLNELSEDKLAAIKEIMDRPGEPLPEPDVIRLARLLRDALGTNDVLRRAESLLTQVKPEASINVLPQGTRVGKLRGFANTREDEDQHVTLTQDVYLGASHGRGDAILTLLEELIHLLAHRGRTAAGGGYHSARDYLMEREAKRVQFEYFKPDLERFRSAKDASRRLGLPEWFTEEAMKHHARRFDPSLAAKFNALAAEMRRRNGVRRIGESRMH